MRDVPDCLHRRYKALDELVQELSAVVSSQDMHIYRNNSNDPGIKLMCEFWNILKADPDCNLTQAVKKRMLNKPSNSSVFGPRRISCYMAQEDNNKKSEACGRKNPCCQPDPADICCPGPLSSEISKSSIPLSKVLCNLKEAASFDKKCNDRITDLMQTQNELREQIQRLEQREKEGVELLKQADCMWSCMEEAYKKKLESSQKKQQELMKQLKEVETNNAKWRKNKKDLELQMKNLNKCHQDIIEKITSKTNDMTCINSEIADFQKRLDNCKKETDAANKCICSKKQATDAKITRYTAEVSKLCTTLNEENKLRRKKEEEGTKYIKDARDDLQKICRVLLQKKLENEDLKAEADALREEIELVNQSMDQCKERCTSKQDKMKDEIKSIDKQMAAYKFQCIQCHQCVDTSDVRKMCTDCPRCLEERECITKDGHCVPDPSWDCVCMDVKQKFLDNVFENMYTVLARQSATKPGKAVAEAILKSLKKSRNGKLNKETRQIVQDFILTTVKKNLNLTIVGGAVKTRCEMDPETYNQLMLCLKQVKVVKPPKEDKAIPAKKESCRRWGGTSECNCPKGPKSCICTKKAPPPPDDKEPLPPPDPADVDPGEITLCPIKKDTACGPDCGMRTPSAVGTEITWKREPCKTPSCAFSNNMRAAQCMLGPEPLTISKSLKGQKSIFPPNAFADLIQSYKSKPMKPIIIKPDRRSQPRERIIEEVMGKYTDLSSPGKVPSPDERSKQKKIEETKQCVCSNSETRKTDTSKLSPECMCECPSGWFFLDGTDALKELLNKKRVTHVCKTIKNYPVIEPEKCEYSKSEILNGSQDRMQYDKYDERIKFILHPRFRPTPNHNNTDDNHRFCKTQCKDSKTNKIVLANSSSDCLFSKQKIIPRNHICNITKKLINEVIMSDNNGKENVDLDVEWMTVDSLLNKLTSGADSNKDNISNVTNDEIEIQNEPLEMNKKYDSVSINTNKPTQMRIKVSNNKIKKRKTRSTQKHRQL